MDDIKDILFCIFLTITVILILAFLIRTLIVDRLKIRNIKDITVLVTGCGSGFGRDFVLKCLEQDIVVFATCRTQQSADSLYEEYGSKYEGKLFVLQMDVTSDESVERAVKFVSETLRHIGKELHGVVNNAGAPAASLYDDMLTLGDYKQMWEVNGLGVIRVTKAFKNMIKKSRGRIITCTSIVSCCVMPGLGPYTSAKKAASGYMDVLRHELKVFGVDVIEIQPGMFQTAFNERARLLRLMDEAWSKLDDRTRQEYGEEWFEKGKEFVVQFRSIAPSTTVPVVQTYWHALTSRYPYKKYVAGLDCLIFYRPLSWLPTRFQEAVYETIRRFSGTALPAVLVTKKQTNTLNHLRIQNS